MSILINLLLVINLIVGLLLIVVTLMQRPKQEGLGAAFGGGMTDNLFGAQTTNVLAKGTRILGGLFLVLSLTISSLYARQVNTKSNVEKDLLSSPVPVATPEAGADATPEPLASPETPVATPEPIVTPEPTVEPTAEPTVEATPEAVAPESTPEVSAAPVEGTAPVESTPSEAPVAP